MIDSEYQWVKDGKAIRFLVNTLSDMSSECVRILNHFGSPRVIEDIPRDELPCIRRSLEKELERINRDKQ